MNNDFLNFSEFDALVIKKVLSKLENNQSFTYHPLNDATSKKKFLDTCKNLCSNSNIISFINQHGVIAYHGTPKINSGVNILQNGWDVECRMRQVHGPGEYFSLGQNTPEDYSGDNGRIIIALLLLHDSVQYKKVNGFYGETWVVVNNTTNMSFTYPIGFLTKKDNIEKQLISYNTNNNKNNNVVILIKQ